MGSDNGGAKSGGFFNMFDWNRKSRKKLFAGGSVSPESTKQEKSEDNLPTTQQLVDDDEIIGISSGKRNSDYSCASSVTDEEGFAHRAPGVVARLMGLDSMPATGISELNSTAFFDKQSLKGSPEFYINHQFIHIARRPIELRSHKMPSGPIERFQTETLPPRPAKSLPITHHKVLSPVKTPGFISAKNAAHVMEAAAKILDPRNQSSVKCKVPSFGPSSIPLRVRVSKENVMVSQSLRKSRILESPKTPFDSTAFIIKGQPLNTRDTNPIDAKGKGKSISLAIQAKVNVQSREGLSMSSRRNSLGQKDQNECNIDQLLESRPITQKNKPQKRPSTTSTSGVLRQNNQKQNSMSRKGNILSKQAMSNQRSRKVLVGDVSSTKKKTPNKLFGNSSSNKDFPRKNIQRGFVTEKSRFIDDVLVDRPQKHVQTNIVIDEHSYSGWKEINRSDGSDVVSFTFTSPLMKPMSRSQFSTQSVENLVKGNTYCFDTCNQKNNEDANDEKLPSHGHSVINGDALGLLLEQKLWELTSGDEPSYVSTLKADSFTASSTVSDFDTIDSDSIEHRYKPGGVIGYGVSSINDHVFGVSKPQGVEECSSSSEAQKELEHHNASPFSILEASSSNETYYLTGSSDSIDGRKTCASSIQARTSVSFDSVNKTPSPEAEMDLSDSASSTLTENSDASQILQTTHTETSNQELHYVSEILFNTDLVLGGEKLNPLLFEGLENKREEEDKDGRFRRKFLFDCVAEGLDLKCSRYFRSGYLAWSKGELVIDKENLINQIYDEILSWKTLGDWMIDEIVDKDMSSPVGKWLEYEIEAFEEGLDIEMEILNSLVDEVITDCLLKGPLLINMLTRGDWIRFSLLRVQPATSPELTVT